MPFSVAILRVKSSKGGQPIYLFLVSQKNLSLGEDYLNLQPLIIWPFAFPFLSPFYT
jgi:hypothetical protein